MVAAFLLLVCVRASGEEPFARGRWIGPGDAASRGSVYRFRRSLRLESAPKSLTVRISADAQFVLVVNGRRVAFGPSRGDLLHWRYETVNLAGSVRRGENQVEAIVWQYPRGTGLAQVSHEPALLVEATDPAFASLDTNASWTVERDPSYAMEARDESAALHGFYAGPPGEVIRAGRADTTAAKPATVLGVANLRGVQFVRTPWLLEADALPPMERSPDTLGVVVRQQGARVTDSGMEVPAHSHAVLLMDHRVLTTGYPVVETAGGDAASIEVTYAEALYDAHGRKRQRDLVEGMTIRGLTDRFVVRGGRRAVFEPLDWRTWRYVQLDVRTGDAPLRLTRLASTFTAFPFQQRAAFTSSDPVLAKIWEVGWRTARLDAHDTYMDTPYWERLQYVGDTRVQALLSYAIAGDDRLARQAIDAFDASRMPEGLTLARAPTALPLVIPPFSLLWVGMLHDFWWYRDDPAFVRGHLPGTRAVLQWFAAHQKANGLLDRMPWWNFVDWAEGFDEGVPPQERDGDSAILTLQWVLALDEAAAMERALGDPSLAAQYEAARSRAVAGIQRLCWNPARQMYADTPAQRSFSEHANVLAVLAGMSGGDWPALLGRVLGNHVLPGQASQGKSGAPTAATYYFDFYVARALEHAGMGDSYLATLTPWKAMLDEGLTTWAENPPPTRSDSHAWSAHPNLYLLEIVAGIRPASPGFEAVVLEPHPGSLRWFKATYPHRLGAIEEEIQTSATGVSLSVTIPQGLPATLRWCGRESSLHAGQQTLTLPSCKP